ncbi:ATP-binding protein [Dactylosporangium matsuzakiense]|nr:ATP-binding protein [Dactylosporangium matsuzakiense]UWZ48728.1 ATP-binding protein [Dactylosporangium matsuzakiense]
MMTVTVQHHLDEEIIGIAVGGVLSTESKHRLRSSIGKSIIACPRAVIVDLTDFDDPTGTAAPLFQAAQRRSLRDHGVSLLYVVPARGQLRARLAHPFWHRALRLYRTRADAYASARRGPPAPDRFALALEPDDFAPSRARLLVHGACRLWDVPEVATAACRIVFELVHNAVRHAGTGIHLTVSRRGNYLHIGVRDGDPRPAVKLPPRGPAAAPGDGLRIVDRDATAWGCLRNAGGKIAWAAIWLPPGKPPKDETRH